MRSLMPCWRLPGTCRRLMMSRWWSSHAIARRLSSTDVKKIVPGGMPIKVAQPFDAGRWSDAGGKLPQVAAICLHAPETDLAALVDAHKHQCFAVRTPARALITIGRIVGELLSGASAITEPDMTAGNECR